MRPRKLLILVPFLTAATAAHAQPAGDPNGPYCREFTQKVIIGGRPQTAYGTSCRQPDGSWQVIGAPADAPPPPNLPPNAVPYAPGYTMVAPPVYYEPYYYPAYYSSPGYVSFGFSSGGGRGYHGGGWRR